MTDRARMTCGVISGLCVIAMLWLAFGGSTATYERGEGSSTLPDASEETDATFAVDCNPVSWGMLRQWTSADRKIDDGYSVTEGTMSGESSAEVAGRCEQIRSGKASFMALLAVPAAVLGTAATVSGRRKQRDARPDHAGTIGSGSG